MKNNRLSEEVLEEWDTKFVPDYDLLFFENKPTKFTAVSREDGYSQLSLDERTSFLTWNVHPKCKWIAKVSNESFLSLHKDVQIELLLDQVANGRGFHFRFRELIEINPDPSALAILEEILLKYNGEEIVVFQGWSWKLLPISFRFKLLESISKSFVSSVSIQINEEVATNPALINTFTGCNGPNCFAFTLMNLEKEDARRIHIAQSWIVGDEFLSSLESYEYKKVSSRNTVDSEDVLVWFNNDTPVHGCYAINETVLLNKNGQTMFHPYQCQSVHKVLDDWFNKGFKLIIYRK